VTSPSAKETKRQRLARLEVERVQEMLAKRKAKVVDAERKLAAARERRSRS
jgi:hypothetical protein